MNKLLDCVLGRRGRAWNRYLKLTSGHTAGTHQLWVPPPTWRETIAQSVRRPPTFLLSASLNIHETHLRHCKTCLLPWAVMSYWGDGGFLDVIGSLGEKWYNMVDVSEDLMERGDLTVWQQLSDSRVCFTSSVKTNSVIIWAVRPAAGSVGSSTFRDEDHPFTSWLWS